VRRVCLLLAALLTLAPIARAEKPRVVLLPFGNLSGVERAQGALVPSLALKLTAKGWDVVRGEEVDDFLRKERVRYVDSLTASTRTKILAAFSADAAVTGTIYAFADGDNAVTALSARMVRGDGSVAWTSTVGLTADETEGLLGLGRAKTLVALADRALDRLVVTLPAPGEKARVETRSAPILKASPPTYKAVALKGEAVRRVCILPLANFTDVRIAPRVLTDLLQHELEASGRFEVVEPADLRAALVAEKVRGISSLDPAALAAIGRRVGTSLFLGGTVYRYWDPGVRATSATPEVDLEIVLVDATAGRIVWTGGNARKGRDYKGLFQLGALRSVVALSDQVLGELVTAEAKATPRDVPAQLAKVKKRPPLEPIETSVRAGRTGGGG
jgi:hypothetical protein